MRASEAIKPLVIARRPKGNEAIQGGYSAVTALDCFGLRPRNDEERMDLPTAR